MCIKPYYSKDPNFLVGFFESPFFLVTLRSLTLFQLSVGYILLCVCDGLDNDGFTMRSSNNGGFHSTQTLERLEKTRLVQDYLRLHLGSSLADNNSTHTWTKTVKLGGSFYIIQRANVNETIQISENKIKLIFIL